MATRAVLVRKAPPPPPEPKKKAAPDTEADDESDEETPTEALYDALDAISQWVAVARNALADIEEQEA